MIRTPMRTTRFWGTWGFDAAREVEDRTGRRVQRIECGAYAGDVGRGAGMAAHKAGRNVHRRHARSGRALGSHRGEIDLWEIDQSARGFSFREAGPLDMRMDAGTGELTAEEIVNRWPERELADLLYREADEHDSRRIARAIVRARPIRETAHLATTVAGARKQWGRQRLHPATKTFLALRIAVNREMEELGQFLSRTPATMNSGGRWVVLSYHSREDRMVKEAFREAAKQGTLKILTKHVVRPSEEEERMNPRSRSAKLRCAERLTA